MAKYTTREACPTVARNPARPGFGADKCGIINRERPDFSPEIQVHFG